MDDIRSSFSRFKKDIKHRIRGTKHAPDRVGANTAGERADPSDSLLRPDSRVTASGHDEEGGRTSTDVLQGLSRGRSPQPEPIPVTKGDDESQRKETDLDEKEAGQRHSGLESDVKAAMGSGPDQGAHSSPASLSLPHKGEPGCG